ncbi:MAG TPA: hypothetical protein VMS31_08845 [Pyrinomonadaceae bacterium]|nr:hypothetical protein [Pyrinomonadaceae bacterium]
MQNRSVSSKTKKGTKTGRVERIAPLLVDAAVWKLEVLSSDAHGGELERVRIGEEISAVKWQCVCPNL